EVPRDELLRYTLSAGFLAQLAVQCGFLQQDGPSEELEFAGGILMRHLAQLAAHSQPISRLVPASDGTAREVTIGQGVFPALSLVKRSERPNVVANFVHGYTLVLRAAKKIDAGQEVIMSGGGLLLLPEEANKV